MGRLFRQLIAVNTPPKAFELPNSDRRWRVKAEPGIEEALLKGAGESRNVVLRPWLATSGIPAELLELDLEGATNPS
jgi:hypothetical protein